MLIAFEKSMVTFQNWPKRPSRAKGLKSTIPVNKKGRKYSQFRSWNLTFLIEKQFKSRETSECSNNFITDNMYLSVVRNSFVL